MQDKIDYYLHKTYEPPYYHRQYEQDLPENPEGSSSIETAKRAVHIATPFLSLYQPFGSAISLTMGSVRVLSSSVGVVTSDDMTTCATQVMHVSLAVLALAGTLYHFTLGLYISTCADITGNLIRIFETLYAHEYKQAGEELLQALTSGLYLGIMMTGSLEVALASILIQALVSFYQAREEWANGRMPEAFAKSLMGFVRLYQANTQVQQIQRRNLLIKKYQEFIERLQKGREIDHLWDHPLIERVQNESKMTPQQKQLAEKVDGALPKDHPLSDLPTQIDKERVVLEDAKGNQYDFGSYFNGYGKQLVKGMNVHFKNEGDKTTLDFKVNHVFRERLEKVIQDLEHTSQEDLKDLFKVFGSHIKDVSITRKTISHPHWDTFNEIYEIHLQGLGTISVGAFRDNITLFDKISVEMDKGKSLYDFHEALSFLKLDDALRQSAFQDMEKMKMGFLFRMFDPHNATFFERSDDFFDLSLEAFKQEIFCRSPEMGKVFENYLPRLQLRETIGGKKRLALDGLADELTAKGARGLTAAITGTWWSDQEMYERVASILKMGMISSEMRNESGMNKKGLSSGTDYFTGGADTVFTQMITDKQKSYSDSMYSFWSDVSLMISPKILESGTYQYHDDSFGTRLVDNDEWWWLGNKYPYRPDIFNFLKEERNYHNWDNEVMVKDRIPPEFFTGILVSDQNTKLDLLDYLRKAGLVTKNKQGQEEILSRLINDFIFVGDTVKDKHFN